MGRDGVRDLKSAKTGLPGSPPSEVLEVVGDLEGHAQVPAEGLEPPGDLLPAREPPGGRAAEPEQRTGLALHDRPEALHRER
jgi:hypothetical protein